jgi:acetyltransferase-like isoleucine patch superfamily enzyme/ubiquinone/menaquinone biosynthesis C-methylase UbiE
MLQQGVFNDLAGRQNVFEYDATTFIDPDVVIDEPGSVSIGQHCALRKGVVLRPESGHIVIGDHCTINHYCVLHAKGGITIGDWTIIAPHCGIYAQNHSFAAFDVPMTQQPNIGRGVYLMGDNWLGGHAVLCDDVTLGKGAVIGANATVTRSVPMACIAAGSPARVIKKRHEGPWDFAKVERAVLSGDMPAAIRTHVESRGERLAALLHAEDHVLDVGCGEGLITAMLAPRCARIVGCDYSREALRIARHAAPQIEFVYSNATYLRFPERAFSAVVLADVAEHLLPPQFRHALAEATRVLVEGGRLLVATPLTGKGRQTSTYAHIYEYSRGQLVDLLARHFRQTELVDAELGIFNATR